MRSIIWGKGRGLLLKKQPQKAARQSPMDYGGMDRGTGYVRGVLGYGMDLDDDDYFLDGRWASMTRISILWTQGISLWAGMTSEGFGDGRTDGGWLGHDERSGGWKCELRG